MKFIFGGTSMKKQTAVGLFFSMFLRATVVILGIAIIIFGIVFLTTVIKNENKKDNTPVTTVDENVLYDPGVRDDLLDATEEASSDTQETVNEVATSYDKKIAVLNSTDIGGLAGRWCQKLNGYGYSNTYATDFSNTLTNTLIVAKEDGVGEDLVQYFNGASYQVGNMPEGAYESLDDYDIVIIIGTNDDDGQ